MDHCHIAGFLLVGVLLFGLVVAQEETNDRMFRDSAAVQTLGVCEEGSNCGFLTFDERPQDNRYYKFTHYCNCPDDQECVRKRADPEHRSFYFVCRDAKILEESISDSFSDFSPVSAENRQDRSLSEESSTQDSTGSSKRFGYVNEEL